MTGIDDEVPSWQEPTGELPRVEVPTMEMPVAGRRPDPLPEPAPPPAAERDDLHPPHVRRLLFGGLAAGLLIVGTLAVASVGGDRDGATPPAAAAAPAPEAAGIDLVSEGGPVTVRTADLGGELYRVRPAGRATGTGGRIRLTVGGGPVELVLATGVRWDLGLDGAAERREIDLAGGRFSAVAMTGGATHVDLRLPRPDGTLAVRVLGGVNRFEMHTANGTPVRVRVGSGAGAVTVAGRTHNGVAAGALFTPAGWSDTPDRVDLDAAAGMARLTVS